MTEEKKSEDWVAINPRHEAADAFWECWKKNGETHKHGYYESTWMAINAAILAGGLRSTRKRPEVGDD
jgi:hypothetical protein